MGATDEGDLLPIGEDLDTSDVVDRMTPEGKVKAAVKRELDKYPGHYREMPVPGGYGKSGLDFTVCFFGHFLAIETKAEGKQPTERQLQRMEEIRKAGGIAVSVIGVDEAKTKLRALLSNLTG
jgi:hypothetical protein